jgi:hypothetical protein
MNSSALAEMSQQLRRNLIASSKRGERETFFKCYGPSSIASQIARDIGRSAIVASGKADEAQFKGECRHYLLY